MTEPAGFFGHICPAHGLHFPSEWGEDQECPVRDCSVPLRRLDYRTIVLAFMKQLMEKHHLALKADNEQSAWYYLRNYNSMAEEIGFRPSLPSMDRIAEAQRIFSSAGESRVVVDGEDGVNLSNLAAQG